MAACKARARSSFKHARCAPGSCWQPPRLSWPTWLPASLQVADQFGVSSLHINFATQEEWGELGAKHGYLQRTGLQYHWYNGDITKSMLASAGSGDSYDDDAFAHANPYSSFDDAGDERSFLMSLRQSKRKSIRQVGQWWGRACLLASWDQDRELINCCSSNASPLGIHRCV